MEATDQRKMTAREVGDKLNVSRQYATRMFNSGVFGEVSTVEVNGQKTKAVSRERVLTYIEESKVPDGAVSVADAAETLGVTEKWVYTLGKRGVLELVEYRFGNTRTRYAVTMDSLDAYIDATR